MNATPPDDPRALYLDLMKKVLTNWIYGEAEYRPMRYRGVRGRLRRAAVAAIAGRRAFLARRRPFVPGERAEGRDWPQAAHTMIGLRRLDNLQYCVEQVLKENVPGDLIEAGVWRGGASIFMRAILKAHGDRERRVWVADSFEGLPPPDPRFPQDRDSTFHVHRSLCIPLEEVKANFERYGLLDGQVRFLRGWFKDTLPTAPIERLAVARLDGDMYESTLTSLTSLYPRLSPGGYLIVDDYAGFEACRQAVTDFREQQGIADEIRTIDWTGAFWKKSSGEVGNNSS